MHSNDVQCVSECHTMCALLFVSMSLQPERQPQVCMETTSEVPLEETATTQAAFGLEL